MSADRTSDAYVFDRYRLSADGSLLVRDGTVVALAPKVLQILREPGIGKTTLVETFLQGLGDLCAIGRGLPTA